MMLISSSHLSILKIDLNLVRHLLIHILATTEACGYSYDFKTQRSMRDTPIT
jgi:hypothetical protein